MPPSLIKHLAKQGFSLDESNNIRKKIYSDIRFYETYDKMGLILKLQGWFGWWDVNLFSL